MIFKPIILFLVLLINIYGLKINHNSWNLEEKKRISVTDVKWNYCDFKCLYLERYYP